jgi:curli biogenesis system outer membrane secretion channel CsgG
MHALLVAAFAAIPSGLFSQGEEASPEPVAKPVVAVVDFNAKSARIVIGEGVSDYIFTGGYVDMLNSEFLGALVSDTTFDVIDRARLRDLAGDRLLDTVTPMTMTEIGKAAGADYVVCGDIELVELTKRLQQYPGYSQTQLLGHMVVNIRIVEVATSRIRHASKVDLVQRAAIDEYGTITAASFMEKLKSGAVQRLVSGISEGISPIQVRAVHEGRVYLNRGEQAFKGGELLEIVMPVDVIYDVDGSILDVIEERAGVVRVESVRPKVAIAVVVEELRPMQVGFIARRIENQ